MGEVIAWLRERKYLNVLLIIVYFILVVAPHKRFGTFINKVIFKEFSRDQSNMVIFIIAVLALLAYSYFFFSRARNQPDSGKLFSFMILNTLLAAVVMKLLFVNNVEVVHYPQYALFSVLLFPLIGNYTATMVWATIGGMIDEAYQYFYLAPLDTSYYDMNDIITNIVGLSFGLLLLRAFGIEEYTEFRWKRSSIWIGLSLVVLAVIVTHASGILSIYPNDDRPFHILREWPGGFWSKVHPNITYHVIRPIEGLVLIGILWITFSRIRPPQESEP